MRPRQLFGVIVRAAGLALLFISFGALSHVFAHLFGISIPSKLSLTGDLWSACFYFGTGLALTRGADWIVRFAYGPGVDTSN